MDDFMFEDFNLGDLNNSYVDFWEPAPSPTADLFSLPIDERMTQFKAFAESPEGQQFSSEQLKQLEDLVAGGISPSQMQELSDQAEADVKPGGIMSPGAGGGLGTAARATSKNLLQRLLSGDLKEGDLTSLFKGLGAAYMAKKAYDEGQEAQKLSSRRDYGKKYSCNCVAYSVPRY